jgi:hypothetical protein
MTEADPLLDRSAIRDAFRRLGERLARRGVVADIYVIGGAAMALAYDARRATRDIDAVFHPHGIVLEEARAVAVELGLPSWWLNEQASAYVASGGDAGAPRVFDHPGLRVSAASPEQVAAVHGGDFAPAEACECGEQDQGADFLARSGGNLDAIMPGVIVVGPENARRPSRRLSCVRAQP